MNDKYDNIEVSLERFYVNDKTIENELLNVPRLTKSNLTRHFKPGDLILVYPKPNSKLEELRYKTNSFVQGMAFSSIKYVGLNNNIIGYGIKRLALDEVKYNFVAKKYAGIVILRHKKMTIKKATDIYNWLKLQLLKNIPYDMLGTIMSVIRRSLKIEGKKLTKEEIDISIKKLYCSNILQLAFKHFGLDTGIKSLGDFDIFPKDFLYSKNFAKVGMYLAEGELQKSVVSLEPIIEKDPLDDMMMIDMEDLKVAVKSLESKSHISAFKTKVLQHINVSKNIDKTEDEVAEIIYSEYVKRTNMHKDLVYKFGMKLTPILSKLDVDIESYEQNLKDHDKDKYKLDIGPIYAIAIGNERNEKLKGLYTLADGVKEEFDTSIWPIHYGRNEHHVGEHFGVKQPNGETWKVQSDNHPLAIAEMVADWMAMGVELGNSANAWWKLCQEKQKYVFQPNDLSLINELLSIEKDISITHNKLKRPPSNPNVSIEGAWVESVALNEDGAVVITSPISDDTHVGICYEYDIPTGVVLTKSHFEETKLGESVRHSDDPTCELRESIARSAGRNRRQYILATLHDYDPPTELTLNYNEVIEKYLHIAKFISYSKNESDIDVSTEGLNDNLQSKINDKTSIINIGLEHLDVSTESSSNISAKKKAVLAHICKMCDIMDPSKLNSKRYTQLISGMTDKQFDTFMTDMRDGRFQLHLVAPNMKVNLKVKDLIAAADAMKLKLFHRIWMRDNATGRKFLSDNEYLVVQLPVRRQEQFIDKKMSVPDNDRSIDGLTGQVSWDSRACALTNPEIQILAARNMNATLFEMANVRGGNINSYAEFKRNLEENGEARLNDLDPNSRTRVAVMGGVLLTAMLIESNL